MLFQATNKTVFKKWDRFIRMTFLYLLTLCLFSLQIESQALSASETIKKTIVSKKHPVGVSFMIADLKYSEERGVKICEVQHGILSTFYGDRFLHGKIGATHENLSHFLLQYHDRAWATPQYFKWYPIKRIFETAPEWYLTDLATIEGDPDFQHRAFLPVYDPYDISNYHGFLGVRPTYSDEYENFKQKYPGIILLDAVTHAYWKDKYKMTELFSKNETLASYKPKWGLYAKKYTKSLANKIIDDLQSDIFVIKPRRGFLGYGVIIVTRENLDSTLEYILTPSDKLRNDSDSSYYPWYLDSFDSFLVEEFVESDPIAVPHLENKIYQPTMKVAFVLVYNNQTIEVKFLSGWWVLPRTPLSEEGTLNDKNKLNTQTLNFCKVDPEVMSKAEQQLRVALSLLYQQMLLE